LGLREQRNAEAAGAALFFVWDDSDAGSATNMTWDWLLGIAGQTVVSLVANRVIRRYPHVSEDSAIF